jgi:RHS repeat-associated protein
MNMRSKAILLIAFLVFITSSLSAQEWDGQGTQFNAESILRNQIVLPSSPEAASLGKFGHIPISPFTGSPQINIPLYQLNGRYLPWSVSLSYDVHAVKVDEVPSWTGLGWTLNGPGVITRSVVGDPDLKRNYFSPVQDLPAGAGEEIMEFQNPDQIIENNFLVSLVNGSIEAQPDMYFFNFGGYSGKFVITRNKQLVYYEFSGLEIFPEFDNITDNIIRFTAYDPEGRKYVFDRIEYTVYNIESVSFTEPRASDAFINTYGEALGGINVGKLTQSRAKMLDGTANFVANNFSYDPFGRMIGQLDNYTLGGVNFSDSWLFSFNHADWQTAIARKHNRGAQALDVVATMAHDNFGREIMYIFGSVPGDAMAVTRAFNDRDELIQKQYGSLGSGSYLEKTVFRYTPRGWIEEMNPVVARKDDWTYCSRPTQPPSPGGVHEEAQVSLDELLDRIAAGEQIRVNDLDPCENGECYERLYTWEVSYDLWRSANNAITQIRAAGQTLNLPNYNYEIADSMQLRADLGAWLTANGYVYAGIDFEVEGGQTPGGAPTWRGTIRIRRTNLTFEYIRDLQGIPYSFKRSELSFEPCKNIKDRPIGETSAQAASVAALDAQMPALTPATMTFPTLMYKVFLPGIGVRWVAREELPTLVGPYQRLGRVHIGSNQQTFQVKRTDGSSATLNLAQMLSERAQGLLDDISPKDETNNSTECNLEPLGCTPYEIQQQNSSLASIMSQMAQLNAAGLSFPITLYLVQLCDGSTIYILGQNLLSQLLGPHIVLDQLLITGPDQLISVTVIRKDPLFAMEFDYELNGNMEEARWKVTRHNPKYYRYGYDGLNRVTVANYGDILLTENPANGSLNLQILETNTYRGWNYAYDAIGNLERLSRNGFIGGPTCEWGMIDDLTYSYDAQRAHLTGVADAAPLPGRDKGFKPKPGAGAYLYDDNGNMTFDPHKDITITYNFLNLPSQIVKTGAGGGAMSLTYDAAGRKWRKQVTGVTKDYCQGIEYKDGKVEAVYGQEGRLTAVYDQYGVTLTRFRAEYWLKDHLGNTRLAFADENHNGTIEVWDDPSTPENEAEIIQENHYYPFGMNHEGPWYATIGPRNGYQYNGKELNEELELGWNDFGARWQDPATGRWWQVDPLGEDYYSISSYAYVVNNPLKYIDPDGRYIDIEYEDENGEIQKYRYGSGDKIKNKFVKQVVKTLDKLTKKGADVEGIINTLKDDDSSITINEIGWDDHNATVSLGSGGNISWSPEGGIVTDEGENRSPSVGLLHELGHTYFDVYKRDQAVDEPKIEDFDNIEDFNKAYNAYESSFGAYDNPEDKWVIERVENPAAINLGQPTRKAHSYKRKFQARGPFSVKEKKN